MQKRQYLLSCCVFHSKCQHIIKTLEIGCVKIVFHLLIIYCTVCKSEGFELRLSEKKMWQATIGAYSGSVEVPMKETLNRCQIVFCLDGIFNSINRNIIRGYYCQWKLTHLYLKACLLIQGSRLQKSIMTLFLTNMQIE